MSNESKVHPIFIFNIELIKQYRHIKSLYAGKVFTIVNKSFSRFGGKILFLDQTGKYTTTFSLALHFETIDDAIAFLSDNGKSLIEFDIYELNGFDIEQFVSEIKNNNVQYFLESDFSFYRDFEDDSE